VWVCYHSHTSVITCGAYSILHVVSVSKSEIAADSDVRLIQSFLDVLILKVLKKSNYTNGYSLITHFHQKFHIMVSPGTVYSKLYGLERQCFLEGFFDGRIRIYRLTKKGEEHLNRVLMAEQRNRAAFLSIFSASDAEQT
jgi:DNA-binding PadR family transcriptional regulator